MQDEHGNYSTCHTYAPSIYNPLFPIHANSLLREERETGKSEQDATQRIANEIKLSLQVCDKKNMRGKFLSETAHIGIEIIFILLDKYESILRVQTRSSVISL